MCFQFLQIHLKLSTQHSLQINNYLHFLHFYILFLVNPVVEIAKGKGEMVTRNGVEYVSIKKAELKVLSLGKLILKMDNLFQGNKELSKYFH